MYDRDTIQVEGDDSLKASPSKQYRKKNRYLFVVFSFHHKYNFTFHRLGCEIIMHIL